MSSLKPETLDEPPRPVIPTPSPEVPADALIGPRRHGRTAFAVAFAVAFALFLLTILPISAPILLGSLLAAFATPLRIRIEKRFRGRAVAAASLTLAIVVVVFVPLVLLGVVVAERAVRVVAKLPELLEWLGPGGGLSVFLADKPTLARLVPSDLGQEISAAVAAIGGWIPTVLSSFAETALAIFLTLVTTYYLLRDGRWILARVERALPLEPRHTRAIVHEFQGVGRGVIVGTLGTGLAQGVVAGVGYWVLGLPEPLLLGVLTFVASPLPVMGSGLIWVPAAIGLIIAGHPSRGIALLLYGVVVIGSLDNLLRPFLTRSGQDVHPLLVFLGLFGGVVAFGPSGIFLGPLFVSLFIALARIYEREMAHSAAGDGTERVPELTIGGRLKGMIDKSRRKTLR
jgi:predicted PurR-regulated permease PerM